MKYLLLLTLMSFSLVTFSQQLVIFEEEVVCNLADGGSFCQPTDKGKTKFMRVFKKADFRNAAKVKEIPLTTPPLEWGKKVSDDTKGELEFYPNLPKGFVTNLTITHLKPNHTYILTLNGNPELDGNNLLPDPVPQLPEEKYYDFLTVQTNADGAYQAKLGVFLKKGDYHVRFYVKDKSDSKIILYHDYFRFKVR